MVSTIKSPGQRAVRKVLQRQHRLTREEIEQLGRAYLGGASTYELASEWKINRDTVTLALKRAGASIRTAVLTDAQLEEALSLREQGWSFNALGRRFGVDPKTMKKRLLGGQPWAGKAPLKSRSQQLNAH